MNAVEINLYRHGHTGRNDTQDIVFGQSLDEPLDELGLAQAEQLGAFQDENDLIPGYVFTSHAERGLVTAETAVGVLALRGRLSREFPVQKDQRLVEQSLGYHEGRQRLEVYTPAVKARIQHELADYRHPGGESMRDASDRGYAALVSSARLAESTSVEQVDLYSHNMTIASILARIEGANSSQEMHEYVRRMLLAKRIGYVSRTLVVWEKDRFKVEHIGEPTIL
jgi:broad specificity phosphatase PhoE